MSLLLLPKPTGNGLPYPIGSKQGIESVATGPTRCRVLFGPPL